MREIGIALKKPGRPSKETAKPAISTEAVIIDQTVGIRDEALKQITHLNLGKSQRRLKANHAMKLKYGDDVLNAISARCTEVESGARNVDNIPTNFLLPEISNRILTMMATGEKQESITVSLAEDGSFAYN